MLDWTKYANRLNKYTRHSSLRAETLLLTPLIMLKPGSIWIEDALKVKHLYLKAVH